MFKKSLVLMSISVAFFAQAQDISTVRNSIYEYSNFPMTGSSKYNSMAGSNGALGGDANSLLTNPAGLGVAISGDLSGTLLLSNSKNTSSLNGSSIKYNINKFDVGNIGGVMTFQLLTETPWKFINVGVNYSNQSVEDYVETPGNSNLTYDFGNGNSSTYGGHAYNKYGNISKTSVGVGANYNNSFFLGAGLNFLNASIDQYDTAVFNSTANGSAEYFDKQNTPYSERSNGFSASLGVIGKINPYFRIGASLETPTFWNITRGYNYYNDSYDGSDGSASEDRKFTSPLKATISAALVASKNFSLNVDYTLGLTKPKYKVYGLAEAELNEFFKLDYKNLSEIKAGAEYRIKQFRLRGGYSYASSPLDNGVIVSAFNNDGSTADRALVLSGKNTATLGLGYDFKSFYIDAAYQNVSSKYNNPFMRSVYDPANGIDSSYYSATNMITSDSYVVSDVKNIRNNFSLTLGWKF